MNMDAAVEPRVGRAATKARNHAANALPGIAALAVGPHRFALGNETFLPTEALKSLEKTPQLRAIGIIRGRG